MTRSLVVILMLLPLSASAQDVKKLLRDPKLDRLMKRLGASQKNPKLKPLNSEEIRSFFEGAPITTLSPLEMQILEDPMIAKAVRSYLDRNADLAKRSPAQLRAEITKLRAEVQRLSAVKCDAPAAAPVAEEAPAKPGPESLEDVANPTHEGEEEERIPDNPDFL